MTLPLEQQYSWEELGKIVADRIEKHQFLVKFNRARFLNWFKLREKVGMRFDWRLVARAYKIWQDLQKENDHFTTIISMEGMGKSTLAAQLCSFISPEMNISDIVFDMPNYIKKLQENATNYKKNKSNKDDKSLCIDEGGISLFSRESMSLSNRLLAKTFMVQRFLNVHVAICIPHYWSLDSMIRNHRVNTLIVIKKRGAYKVFVGKGIKILNRIAAKDKEKNLWAFPCPYEYFWEGNFQKSFPNTIDKDEYEKHKFKHIKSFLEEAKREAQATKMIKVRQLEKEFGLNADIIIRQIQNGQIEGRQIGKQWFITKKAYDKLTMS